MLVHAAQRLVAAAWLAGAPGSLRQPEPEPEPIYGGTPTAKGEFDQVVAITVGSFLCTGTVVAPRLVLTAAHCLDGLASPAPIDVFYGPEVLVGSSVGATDFGVHPDFCGRDSSCTEDIYDLGYIVLEANFVLPSYTPIVATQEDWDAAIREGGTVTLVGYGEADNAAPGEDSLGVKRKVDVEITGQTPAGLEFIAGGDGKDTCEGDSGGPAFVTLPDGSLRLAGILSRGTVPCGKGGVYGVPYAAACWIRDETGVDLLDGTCGSCDCLQTAPDPDEGCGSCRAAPPAEDLTSGLALLALAALRRRRRVTA